MDYHLEVSSSMLPHVPLQSEPEALLWSELTVPDWYSCHDGTDCADILIMVFEIKPVHQGTGPLYRWGWIYFSCFMFLGVCVLEGGTKTHYR